jgi:3alpha(or 20beta)-hydroxysteroid dehydrogenase
MSGVTDKVVIITGAASGQGAAAARLFAQAGAKVVVTDIDEAGKTVAATIGGDSMFVRHDVSDKASWTEVTARTVDRFGRLNVLVNNAGVFKPLSFLDTSDEIWYLHYRVNQLGVFLGMKTAAEVMRKAGGGSIINISSLGAMSSYPGSFAYSSSKWAVRGMTALAAVELAPLGIRVNGVYPGLIDTPMIAENGPERLARYEQALPMKRHGAPDEVAAVVLFLASDAASYVSGAEVKVSGGL